MRVLTNSSSTLTHTSTFTAAISRKRYHAADRIPATHPQTAECATSNTQQDVTDWMLRHPCQSAAAAAKVGRNSIVRYRPDDRQRHRTRAAIRQHPLVQTLHVSHELLGLAVRANGETALAQFE